MICDNVIIFVIIILFSNEHCFQTLRGYAWRGKDCDDNSQQVHPGARSVDNINVIIHTKWLLHSLVNCHSDDDIYRHALQDQAFYC